MVPQDAPLASELVLDVLGEAWTDQNAATATLRGYQQRWRRSWRRRLAAAAAQNRGGGGGGSINEDEGGRNAGGAFEGGGEGGSSDGDRVMWQGCEDAAGRLELATRGGGVPAGKRRRRRAGARTKGQS